MSSDQARAAHERQNNVYKAPRMLYKSAGVESARRGCAIEAQISYPVCVLAHTYAESSGHLKSDAKVRRCASV
jgi:hypothetical protein